MFRVQENEDGTTSVFCRSTGRHIFTLRDNQQPRIPERTTMNRPINVVGPSPKPSSLASVSLLSIEKEFEIKQGTPDQDFDTSEKDGSMSPIFFDIEEEVKEDYFNDTASRDEYARCLNLVPKHTFENEPLTDILKQFPLRFLARSAAYRSLENSAEDLQTYKDKIPDDMPLSSNLGVKFLKLNEHRHFINEQKISLSIKKYDAYCRFPFNTPNPSECNFPKLRCREKKSYPTLCNSKASKHEATHIFTYGRRQRLERMKTLKTGLDKESRRLLRLCNSKKCVVVLQRLDEAEINYWLSKKTEPILVVIDDSDDETMDFSVSSKILANTCETGVVNGALQNRMISYKEDEKGTKDRKGELNLNRCTDSETTPHSLLHSSSSGSTSLPNSSAKKYTQKSLVISKRMLLKNQKLAEECGRCCVQLRDMSNYIHKRNNSYYVEGTNLEVPFYEDYLAFKSSKNPQFKTVQRFRSHSLSNFDRTQNTTPHKHNKSSITHQLEEQSPSPQYRSSSAPLETKTPPPNASQKILCIDLTEDSPPAPEPKQFIVPKEFLVTKWEFRCFGCGFKRTFNNETSHYKASSKVNSAIYEHMRTFHTVEKPEAFLSSYLDRYNNCSIIEAFPGYKGRRLEKK